MADSGTGGSAPVSVNIDACCQACKVFCSSMAIVIGPTPPGTGVIQEAISATGP